MWAVVVVAFARTELFDIEVVFRRGGADYFIPGGNSELNGVTPNAGGAAPYEDCLSGGGGGERGEWEGEVVFLEQGAGGG